MYSKTAINKSVFLSVILVETRKFLSSYFFLFSSYLVFILQHECTYISNIDIPGARAVFGNHECKCVTISNYYLCLT